MSSHFSGAPDTIFYPFTFSVDSKSVWLFRGGLSFGWEAGIHLFLL